jgi:hypothetical protein
MRVCARNVAALTRTITLRQWGNILRERERKYPVQRELGKQLEEVKYRSV